MSDSILKEFQRTEKVFKERKTKVDNSQSSSLKISTLSIMGVCLELNSCFLPWFYTKYIKELILGYRFIVYFEFWNNLDLYLKINLVIMIIGSVISLIAAFETQIYKKFSKYLIFGPMLIICSIFNFPIIDEENFLILNTNVRFISIPQLGFIYAVIGLILIIMGQFSFKNEQNFLSKTVIFIKHSQKRKVNGISFSVLSVFGIILVLISLYFPWYTISEVNCFRMLQSYPYDTSDYFGIIYLFDQRPYELFAYDYFALIYLIDLVILIVGVIISCLFLFRLKNYKNLTKLGFIGIFNILLSVINFTWLIYAYPPVILEPEPEFYMVPSKLIPNIGIYLAFVGILMIILGYLTILTKSNLFSKTVISFKGKKQKSEI